MLVNVNACYVADGTNMVDVDVVHAVLMLMSNGRLSKYYLHRLLLRIYESGKLYVSSKFQHRQVVASHAVIAFSFFELLRASSVTLIEFDNRDLRFFTSN